jgi:hypothetical protein
MTKGKWDKSQGGLVTLSQSKGGKVKMEFTIGGNSPLKRVKVI